MAEFPDYLDEFDAACVIVANEEDLPTGNLRTKAALMALCRMANQARFEYAVIRQLEEQSSVNIGATAFTPAGGTTDG